MPARTKPLSPPPADATWFTQREAAAYLGVGRDLILEACAKRGLRYVRLSPQTVRIRKDWLEEWAATYIRQTGT